MSKKEICKEEGCENVAAVRGLCCKHYEEQFSNRICLIKDCNNPVRAKGYCATHYNVYGKPRKPCAIDGCKGFAVGRSLCKPHYHQASKNGFEGFEKESAEDRFHKNYKVNHETGCWIWTAGASGNGYGTIAENYVDIYAHRFSYEIHKGLIPEGKYVCHDCDTPLCVNPEHLFLGTHLDNMEDMTNKGRSNKLKGQKHNMAKLTDAQVIVIRQRLQAGEKGINLALIYGVTPQMISYIKSGKNWTHLLPAPEKFSIKPRPLTSMA